MTYPAFYMDGQSARRFSVALSHGSQSLVIRNQDQDVLADWPISDIYLFEKSRPDDPLILCCHKKGRARLHIDDEVTKQWVYNIVPGLMSRTKDRSEYKMAWYISAASLLGLTGIYFLYPLLMQMMVVFVPVQWERDHFAGAGVELAEQIGAKNLCVAPSGQAVLDQIVARIVGKEAATNISVNVVDHKMVNAFATPGQDIVLMRGLIQKADSADEVVGVLAHELGHIHHRHAMQAILRSAGTRFVISLLSGGTGMDMAVLMAETSYSRDHERAADLYALEALAREEISTQGLAGFFEKMDRENHGLESVLQLVSTHPMSQERAAMISAQKGGGPALSDQDWQALKDICSTRNPL